MSTHNDALAKVTEFHKYDRQMWDATRRRAEAAEVALAKMTEKRDEAEATLATRDAEIVKAVAAEREACAKLVENHRGFWQGAHGLTRPAHQDELAAAIRARGGQNE